MAEHQVLFCPFCRESFEGVVRCPEHDLVLVSFDRLGPDPLEPAPSLDLLDSEPLDAWETGYGRGPVAVGALLNLAALGFEFVRGVGQSAGLTTRELAVTAPTLWTLPLVSVTVLIVLGQRRTPRALRGLRLLVPILSTISPLTCAWVLWRLHHGGVVWATGGRTIGLAVGSAPWVVGLSAALMLMGGVRLGVRRGHDRRRVPEAWVDERQGS